MPLRLPVDSSTMSRLSEASGLKCKTCPCPYSGSPVSPLRGEWIEIRIARGDFSMKSPSRLSEASGLKWRTTTEGIKMINVSPLRGEWIEIIFRRAAFVGVFGLASQRRVD